MSHEHAHSHDHGHSHGLIHHSIKRSRAGLRAVGLSLAILGLTALAQVAIFVATGSIALLADLLIGLGISVLIMRITWQSWRTVRDGHSH